MLNGTVYKVVRTNNVCGLGPDPCELCDKSLRKRCKNPTGKDIQPCELYHKGYFLAHFEKTSIKYTVIETR